MTHIRKVGEMVLGYVTEEFTLHFLQIHSSKTDLDFVSIA